MDTLPMNRFFRDILAVNKINLKKLIYTITFTGSILSLEAQADTITQCENISRPSGYLTIEKNILNGTCITKKSIKYATPYQGMWILEPQELSSFSNPWWVVTTVEETIASSSFRISQVVDGIVACAFAAQPPSNYFSIPNGYIPNCSHKYTGVGIGNSVKYEKIFYTDLIISNNPGKLAVTLNPRNPEQSLNYVIRTTANLNGNITTVSKTGLNTSGQYTLNYLAPSLILQAQKGANFTFQIEVFTGVKPIASSTVSATGLQMLGMPPAKTSRFLWSNTGLPSMQAEKSSDFILNGGQSLALGQQVALGSYLLVFQTDGNLVIYGPNNSVVWASYTQNKGATNAIMQNDGNFVIYDANGTALWNTGTYNNPGAYLMFQDNGTLSIIKKD
ncbi:hypothetical protein [Pseudomonas sp. WAC2]|uniref:hypothetical protein n=1 Tax=Pseudomonas sp. WAC2 TaxID=3055057 RepID=UPI0025B13803|nr:hypothetical protein [Pseudomonas sp. WAC2]MDN3238034.1 hypothetical protein [Pseudomonas sp. WAC2]